ncbi:MAG: hypothetical protein JSS17_07180 [Proteobacteria bacterium]|nr:hypothetical protein [Pseudomonadota bacterium]
MADMAAIRRTLTAQSAALSSLHRSRAVVPFEISMELTQMRFARQLIYHGFVIFYPQVLQTIP